MIEAHLQDGNPLEGFLVQRLLLEVGSRTSRTTMRCSGRYRKEKKGVHRESSILACCHCDVIVSVRVQHHEQLATGRLFFREAWDTSNSVTVQLRVVHLGDEGPWPSRAQTPALSLRDRPRSRTLSCHTATRSTQPHRHGVMRRVGSFSSLAVGPTVCTSQLAACVCTKT